MLNWISIIAIAMTFFIGTPAKNMKMESRPNVDTFPKQSLQQLDDPLMMLFILGVSNGNYSPAFDPSGPTLR
jgi:hypothetical protein